MKILVIASAEWLNKKLLFLTIPLVWLTILIAPMLGGQSAESARDTWLLIAVGSAFPLTALLGLIFGAGMFGPDIEEGRLEFYLAQPIRPATLFMGKLLGTILLVFTVGLLAMLPALALHLGKGNAWMAILPLAAVAIAAPLAGHALSIALRARTLWLLLDLMGIGAVVSAFLWFLRWMWVLSALQTVAIVLAGLSIVGLVVLAVAGCLQVSKGRTDLKLGHRWLSSVWAIFPVMVIATLMITQHRTLNVEAASIQSVWAVTALANGPWAEVITGAKGHGAHLLINTETGRGIRLGEGPIATSLNGKRAVWLQAPAPGQSTKSCEAWVLDLEAKDYRLRPTGIQVGQLNGSMVMDAEGKRIAMLEEHSLLVYDVGTGVLLARWARDAGSDFYTQLVFLDADHLRSYGHSRRDNGKSVHIYDLDILSGRQAQVGILQQGRILDREPHADSLLVRKGPGGSEGLDLVNAKSGALIKSLVPDGEAWALDAAFLRDGSIILASIGPKGLRAHHLASNGESLSIMQISGVLPTSKAQSGYPWIGEEVAPGKVQFGFHSTTEKGPNQMLEMDLASGACHSMPPQVERWDFNLARRKLMGPSGAGSLSGRLRISGDHALEIMESGGQMRRLTAASISTP